MAQNGTFRVSLHVLCANIIPDDSFNVFHF